MLGLDLSLEERRSWDGGDVDVNVESRPRTVQNGQRKQESMEDLSSPELLYEDLIYHSHEICPI